MTDPFHILQGHDPADIDEVDAFAANNAASVKDSIVGSLRPLASTQPAPSRTLRRIAVVAAGVAMVAAAFIVTRPPTVAEAVACYSDVSLSADVVAAQQRTGDPSPEACRDPWADGDLVNTDIVEEGEVPRMVACINDGAVAVFPTNDSNICASLGLEASEVRNVSDLDGISLVQRELSDYIAMMENECLAVDRMERKARELLDANGLTHWTILVQPGNEDFPCASFAADSDAELIRLTRLPDRNR